MISSLPLRLCRPLFQRTCLRTRFSLRQGMPPWAQPTRLQHDGPHKEYFQDPSRSPLPDPAAIIPEQGPTVPPTSFGRPRIRQALFVTNIILSGVMGGTLAGIGLLTWAYVQGPYEEGSLEEEGMMEEISEMLNEHPDLERLIANPEWEEWGVTSMPLSMNVVGRRSHLVNGTLNRSKGIVLRTFFHRTEKTLRILIYFGIGVESWPDNVHGGAISTVMQEAMEKLAPIALPHTEPGETGELGVQFFARLLPGELYSLSVLQPDRIICEHGASVGLRLGMRPEEESNSLMAFITEPHPANEAPSGIMALSYGTFKQRPSGQEDGDTEAS